MHDRFEIERVAWVRIRSETDQDPAYDRPPQLKLSPILSLDLSEVTNARMHFANSDRQYLSMQGNRVDALITCANPSSVPFPHCDLQFDHRRINIDAHFPANLLSDWKAIEEKGAAFVDCAYDAEYPVRNCGELNWD